MQLYIRPDGSAQCIYDDDVKLSELGQLDVKRASHVEPDPEKPGTWFVDMRPVGGEIVRGFATRREALDYEIARLGEQMAAGPVTVAPV